MFAVLQAPLFHRFSLDPFTFFQNGLSASEVNVCECEVVDALVVSVMIVMINKRVDLRFHIFREEVIVQQDPVFERLMPALDLTLSLWMMGCATDVVHAFVFQPLSQITADVA